jgi:AraC-like DNA-binding protein
MALLLDDFCKKKGLDVSSDAEYPLNDHLPFGEWLKRIKQINKQYPQVGIGLDIGALVQPKHIGIVAYMAQSSDTLFDYIEILAQYEKLWFNYIPKKVLIEENHFSISWDKPAYLQVGLYLEETTIVEEIQVSSLFHHLQQLTDSDASIFHCLELAIPKPIDTKKYQQLFNCPIKFNTKQTRIVIPNSLLQTKLKYYDPILLEILLNHANILLSKMPQEDSFLELVNLSMLQALENNNVQIQNLSITKVAFLLAYKDQTSFNRAFKAWNGVSPSTWRKQNINKTLDVNEKHHVNESFETELNRHDVQLS